MFRTNKEILRVIENDYNEALNDMSYTNRSEAAFNAADNAALALSMNNHGIRFFTEASYELMAQIRAEATSLRKTAIGM